MPSISLEAIGVCRAFMNGERRMEKKMRILAFAAVALMFAVCFIGFVAINDDAVDAESTTTNVAKIGDKEYPTLAEAVNAATDGVTITLLSDITVDERINVYKNVTFNLNGYDITGNDVTAFGICGGNVILDGEGTITSTHSKNLEADNCIIQVYDKDGTGGVSLTIGENVTVNTDYCYGVAIFGNNNVRTELIIKGNVTTESCPAVSGNGTEIYGGTSIVISESATVKTTKTNAIYHPQKGTLNINGTVDGGFEIKSGSTAVIGENAIVKANGQGPSHTASSDGTSTNGYAIAVVENKDYAGSPTVTIGEKSTIIGTINIFADNEVAEGKKGKIVVNGGSFTDIANAVKYATSGATITLAENVTLSSSIVVTKSVTINLNGKTIESSGLVFNIMGKDVTFTIDANDGSISTTGTVVRTNTDKEGYAHANPNVIVKGGIYSGNYVFINYAENGSFSIDKAVVNGKSAGIWFGNGPASKASITDSTIVATNNNSVGIYLGTVEKATLSNINVTGGTGIEIKSGTVRIDGNSTIVGTAKYVVEEDMNNNGSGGSVAAICINNAYVDVDCTGVSRTDGVFVTIGKDVSIVSKNADEKKICITSGHKHGETESVDNAPIFVESKLSDKEVGTVFMSDCKSPIIYNGVARVINDHMYDMIKDDSRVGSYLIESENDNVSLKNLKGNIILNTDKNVTISELTNDITVKGKVGALTITGSGNESVSIELDSAKTLCISNVKDVTVDGGTFTADSYVKVNGGESVVNISNVKETVSVKNVTINAKRDVKGQGISIMNCTEVKRIVISDNKIYNAGHHSIMIGSVFKKLETLDITNNTFSEWGCNVEYSSAIHMFGKEDSSVKATISNNTFTCEMKDSSRLGKIISIGYQNGNEDGDSMGAFNNPVLFTKNVVNGKATDDFNLVVERGATTYLDFGTKYAGNAIDSSVRQDGIDHKAISYGNFIIENGKMMDVGTRGSIIVNGIFELAKGAKLTMHNDSIFTGTILGPDGNKLVANGMKAGDDGITITGGSLIINGKIMDAGGLEAGVTVSVTGDGIKISGSLDANVTMVIEKDTIVTVKSGDEFSFNGTITNNGTLRIEDLTIITTINTSKVVNNGVVIDERAKDKAAVPVTNDGTVVAKNNADKYKEAKVDVVEQDPDKPVATEGKIEVNTNKYAFITPITTTGKLNIVMNDGYKQYTVTIPEGTAIAAGTVISVSFIEYQSDSVTRYQINTPGIENFSMKLPCQIGFKKAKVYCDDSELGVSKVRYDAGTGYVTFDASHNSVFTIVLSNASPAGTTTVSGGDAANDYSLVIAFVVLVASLGFLAYVIRKK